MYKFPLDPGATCPHCGRTLGLTRKLVKCMYSGEVVCTKCIVGGRFSDSVWDKIPQEYQQKFRSVDWLFFFAVVAAGLWLMQSGMWTNPGWDLGNFENAAIQLGISLAWATAGIIFLFASLRLAPLSSWLFARWVRAHPLELKAAADALATGKYEPRSKAFALKMRIIQAAKRTRFSWLHFTALGCSVASIPLYFIVRGNVSLAGSYMSWIAGLIEFVAIVSTIFSAIVAAGYYCKKNPENNAQRRLIELLSWLYIIMLPLVFFTYSLSAVASINFIDELSSEYAMPLMAIHVFATVAMSAISVLLNGFVLFKGKPDFEAKHAPTQPRTGKEIGLRVASNIVLSIFIGILLVLLGLGLLIIVLDATMAIAILSSNAILFGVILPVTFVVLKLARKRPARYNQPYNTLLRLAIVVMAINAVPLVGTMVWTNPSVEAQFAASFGNDWHSQITPAEYARMRQVPFSFFDMVHGYDIPSNARFTIEYCRDSPRYVKWPNGTVISNGSTKFTSIIDTFVFDAYLPPWLDFGDGKPDRLPVIIFMHGIGMSFGTENANWTSQYFANQGYLVCDLEYGFVRMRTYHDSGIPSTSREGRYGYDFPDTIYHVGNFTKFLENATNAAYYHADLKNVYFAGRSFGGWMAPVCAYGYNMSFMGSYFASPVNMTVRGCIPYYGALGIAAGGSDDIFFGADLPYIRGSSKSGAADYNPLWHWMDPYVLADKTQNGNWNLCATMLLHGTNDYVTAGWSRQLEAILEKSGYVAIGAYYPLGAHAFEAIHYLHYGQSTTYYVERFLALTH
ncbi:MAG: alpha/beta hydrolase family protein [Candidatus Sigynarchaeota archaeon]